MLLYVSLHNAFGLNYSEKGRGEREKEGRKEGKGRKGGKEKRREGRKDLTFEQLLYSKNIN